MAGEEDPVIKTYRKETIDYLVKWAQALESSEVRSGRKNAGASEVVDYYTAYFDNAHGGFGFESDIDELKIVIYLGDKEPTDELKEEKIELLVPPVVDGQISPLFRTPCTTKMGEDGTRQRPCLLLLTKWELTRAFQR